MGCLTWGAWATLHVRCNFPGSVICCCILHVAIDHSLILCPNMVLHGVPPIRLHDSTFYGLEDRQWCNADIVSLSANWPRDHWQKWSLIRTIHPLNLVSFAVRLQHGCKVGTVRYVSCLFSRMQWPHWCHRALSVRYSPGLFHWTRAVCRNFTADDRSDSGYQSFKGLVVQRTRGGGGGFPLVMY